MGGTRDSSFRGVGVGVGGLGAREPPHNPVRVKRPPPRPPAPRSLVQTFLRGFARATCQAEHCDAKHEERNAPHEVDRHARGGRAGCAQGRPSVAREQQAQQNEEPADRQPHVERHQKNTAFKITVTTSTTTASVAGRWNQTTAVSTSLGVRPYTRPRSSSGARGRVTSDTRIVTTKHVVQATIAVQKVCASSLGNVVTTPRYPPLTPTEAPAGRDSPWCSAAASVPATSPVNAACPVVRFQNIPNANVANSGAFTNANTSCRKSMMLLNDAAT